MTSPEVQFSRSISGYYDEDELERLLQLTKQLPPDAFVVEIGVECGRSSSIFLQCPDNYQQLWLIDARTHNVDEGRKSTMRLLLQFDKTFDKTKYFELTSDQAFRMLNPEDIDLLHVDADHEKGIWLDCALWLPRLKKGGIVIFHDYKRKGVDPFSGSVFPEVDKAVDYYTSGSDWEDLGTVNTQACRRKLA